MRTFVALGALLGLLACGGGDSDEGASGGDYQRTYDMGENGSADVRVGGAIEVELPAGFSVYPGAKVIGTTTANTPQGKGRTVTMTTSDSIADAAAYYRKQAGDAGVEIASEMNSGDARMFSGASPDGVNVSAFVSSNDEGTTIQLTVAEMAAEPEG